MTYFWNTIQIVGGILSPLAIIYLLSILASFMKLWRDCSAMARAKAELASKLAGRWVIKEIKAVPNPTMSEMVLRNCETQELLTFSGDKEKFREAA